jgi:hypothetical protein
MTQRHIDLDHTICQSSRYLTTGMAIRLVFWIYQEHAFKQLQIRIMWLTLPFGGSKCV